MGIKERLARLERRRQQQVEDYLAGLSDEKLIELVREGSRREAAEDLGVSVEEISDEQVWAWCEENLNLGPGPGRP